MHNQPRNLTITKRARSGPIPDKPIDFPPLDNLHLELLEIKKKIKQGLPLVPIKKRNPPRIHNKVKEDKIIEEKEPINPEKPEKPEEPPQKKEPTQEKKEKEIPQEEEELLIQLGEDNHKEKEDVQLEPEPIIEEPIEEPEEEEYDPYAGLTPEEREAKEKEEYIWRFRILKKQYKSPTVEIPLYNEHSDLPEMKRTYDRTIKELYLDDAVETYRTYLMGGFIVMEFVCIQWVGIDLSGFTIQQTRMMYKYDRLLIELGEKSYSQWGSNLPVEIRIMGFILMQAGIFYLGKIISNKFGNTVAELFKGITGSPPDKPQSSRSSPPSQEESRPKKRMRGPKIKPDDIRNMNHVREDI